MELIRIHGQLNVLGKNQAMKLMLEKATLEKQTAARAAVLRTDDSLLRDIERTREAGPAEFEKKRPTSEWPGWKKRIGDPRNLSA